MFARELVFVFRSSRFWWMQKDHGTLPNAWPQTEQRNKWEEFKGFFWNDRYVQAPEKRSSWHLKSHIYVGRIYLRISWWLCLSLHTTIACLQSRAEVNSVFSHTAVLMRTRLWVKLTVRGEKNRVHARTGRSTIKHGFEYLLFINCVQFSGC